MVKFTAIDMHAEGKPYMTKLEDSDGKSIVVNTSRANDEYMAPSELLAAGLAGCMSMTTKGTLFKAGVSYDEVTVKVEMDRGETKTVFTVDIQVTGSASEAEYEAAKAAAFANCYVHGILSGEIDVVRK